VSALAAGVLALVAGAAQPAARTVALTFDDLPAAAALEPGGLSTAEISAINETIVATLQRHRAPATGFVNEKGVEPDPDGRRAILALWTAAGFDLGNHTHSHADFDRLTIEQFQREIVRGEPSAAALMKAAGKKLTAFRFPMNHTGDTREKHDAIARFLRSRGYALAECTIDTEDFEFERAFVAAQARHDAQVAQELKAAYLAYTSTEIDYYAGLHQQVFDREIPQIMLLHANRLNAAVLEDVLRLFEEKGYRFVSLAAAHDDPAYRTPDSFVTKFGPMWGYRWASLRGLKVDGSKETEPPPWIAQYAK
jgi:peptidoglycan/xylan/chitin deacetylase (PgdA/CDA1 family)